nr:MAG TPA: hypothetical protein [Crassvirales sp.]
MYFAFIFNNYKYICSIIIKLLLVLLLGLFILLITAIIVRFRFSKS